MAPVTARERDSRDTPKGCCHVTSRSSPDCGVTQRDIVTACHGLSRRHGRRGHSADMSEMSTRGRPRPASHRRNRAGQDGAIGRETNWANA